MIQTVDVEGRLAAGGLGWSVALTHRIVQKRVALYAECRMSDTRDMP